MRLLVVSQYFWPEAFIINDLVKTLRNQGHTVAVATGKPNYPAGRIFDGYTARGTVHEKFDGDIDVYRVPMRPRGKAGGLDLVRNYLSFAWSGMIRFPRLLRDFTPDAILVFAPSPITQLAAAIPLKWIKRAHLAYWVQDLWPESLSATGHVRSRAVLGAAGLMVRTLYAFTDTLLVQSRAFAEPVSRYADPRKIIYYPNSFKAMPPEPTVGEPLPADLTAALASHFSVVFAGNIGTVQALPTIVEAARLLKSEPDVRIVVIGDGTMAGWMREEKARLGLDNLLTFGRLPMTSMPAVYRLAGALLVTLRDDAVVSRTVPSKLQPCLAAARPIIAALGGEGARLVKEAGAGLTCAPEDAEALASAIRAMHAMPAGEREAMGAAGHRYFLQHFEMERQAVRLVDILQARIEGRSVSA